MNVERVSFKGNAAGTMSGEFSYYAKKFLREKKFEKEIAAEAPKIIQFIRKFGVLTGEVPNILINAIGTGLVAPFFIKYNFLSKSDSDTRTYSALRQPVSAILAVLMQGGLVLPFDRLMNNMSNKGEWDGHAFNKTGFQDLKYIEKIIKKQNPNLTKAEIKELAKAKQLEQLITMINHANNNNFVGYILDGKKVKLSKNQLKALMRETLDDLSKKHPDIAKNIESLKHNISKGISIKEFSQKIGKISKETDFAYELIQKHIENVAKNIKGFRAIVGLVVSLSILPVSCAALNWLYPRFMDKFFPSLSKKKKDNTNLLKNIQADTFNGKTKEVSQ
ncbi:MAG TPA: hypothetical protein PLG15_01285 [Candidatus Gastranaerophilaceae bacterium]|nr:hypothetical protein [Candidatus Gastranaerophilaceae bacterium]HPT41001.1 hypothetical protein [Candidatus Gastranaerophilaceae bacterium]